MLVTAYSGKEVSTRVFPEPFVLRAHHNNNLALGVANNLG